MEKSYLLSNFDYITSKEYLIKNIPIKRSLYRFRKYFEKNPIIYQILKGLFGTIFFALPLIFMFSLFTKNFIFDYILHFKLIGILPLPQLISFLFLIGYCLFFIVWRAYNTIKSK